MHLNKSSKIVLGIFTFLPFLIVVGAFFIGIYQAFLFSDDPMRPFLLLSYLGYVISYIFFFFLFYIGLCIFYLIHIGQNEFLDTEKRFLWIVVLIMFNAVSMPVYWYIHIWKDLSPKHPQLNASLDQPYESRTNPQKF